MKAELQKLKTILGLLLTLAVVVSVVIPVPALAQPPLNGNVETDFIGPGVVIVSDPIGDVGLPGSAPPGTVSGWDMVDLRLTYDAATDTMYVGINTFGICGDADGDGDPGGTSAWLASTGGVDLLNLGSTETIAVYFDLDKDGSFASPDFDVIAGVSSTDDIFGFKVAEFSGDPYNPGAAFGTSLPTHAGSYHANPSAAAPDFEFTILNFSTLPGSDASVGGFIVWAFLGSIQDDGIGEDYLEASFDPSIDVEKLVSKNNVDFVDADNATWALDVNAGNSVYFRYIVTNTGDVTLTNITLSDDIHDVSGITKTDPLAPSASFSGTIGPFTALSGLHTDVATATGDWDGSKVQDTDPANYFGSGALIDVEKLVSRDNVNFFDADTAGEALQVNVGDNVFFKYIVTNTGDVTLTNIALSDDVHDVSGITKTDPLAPLASFSGTIGPIVALSGLHTDVATATGDWGGFTVEDTDPANYSMPQEVGGTALPVDKLRLLAPWVVLLGCGGVVMLLMLRKRRQA